MKGWISAEISAAHIRERRTFSSGEIAVNTEINCDIVQIGYVSVPFRKNSTLTISVSHQLK